MEPSAEISTGDRPAALVPSMPNCAVVSASMVAEGSAAMPALPSTTTLEPIDPSCDPLSAWVASLDSAASAVADRLAVLVPSTMMSRALKPAASVPSVATCAAVRPNRKKFSSPHSSAISMVAPSRVPIVRAPFIMSFILLVPLAS